MDTIDIDEILSRTKLKHKIKQILIDFEKNKNNLLT